MWFSTSFVGVQLLSFFDIWIKSYGEMKIQEQLWARQASVAANEDELATSIQKGGQQKVGSFRGGGGQPTQLSVTS
jgi:hypothetical protein